MITIPAGIVTAIGIVDSLSALVAKALAEGRDLTNAEIDAALGRADSAGDALDAELLRRERERREREREANKQ